MYSLLTDVAVSLSVVANCWLKPVFKRWFLHPEVQKFAFAHVCICPGKLANSHRGFGGKPAGYSDSTHVHVTNARDIIPITQVLLATQK